MAAEQRQDPGEPPVDRLLGQPRMVADPRISITQAGVVLGKSPVQVHRLIALGRLRRHGAPNNHWPLLLSEVVALHNKGEPMKLVRAARSLGCSIDAVRQLIADGKLPLVPGAKALVYPADVKAIASEVRRIAVTSASSRRQPQGPDGYLDTAAAAKRLGLSESYVRQMAAEEKLPAVFVDGRWRFDPGRVAMVERARRARAVRGVPILQFE